MKISEDKRYYSEEKFVDLNLSKQKIFDKEFEGCVFIDCNFSEAIVENCKFIDCDFKNCNLAMLKLKKSLFNNIYFESSKTMGIDWTEATWSYLKLPCPLKFFKCSLSHSTFFGLSLREIEIIESIAHDVDFREADLFQANLSHTDFDKSMFNKTNLSEANFTEAINYNIDIFFNNIKKATFSLPEATNLLSSLDIYIK